MQTTEITAHNGGIARKPLGGALKTSSAGKQFNSSVRKQSASNKRLRRKRSFMPKSSCAVLRKKNVTSVLGRLTKQRAAKTADPSNILKIPKKSSRL